MGSRKYGFHVQTTIYKMKLIILVSIIIFEVCFAQNWFGRGQQNVPIQQYGVGFNNYNRQQSSYRPWSSRPRSPSNTYGTSNISPAQSLLTRPRGPARYNYRPSVSSKFQQPISTSSSTIPFNPNSNSRPRWNTVPKTTYFKNNITVPNFQSGPVTGNSFGKLIPSASPRPTWNLATA